MAIRHTSCPITSSRHESHKSIPGTKECRWRREEWEDENHRRSAAAVHRDRLRPHPRSTLWSRGQVTVADTRHDDTIAAMAERILTENDGSFALLGTSMGGYVALEVVHQAPERVQALALVSTSARADSDEQKTARARQSALVEDGQFDALIDAAFPGVVAAENESDNDLITQWRAMTTPVGPEAFLRQQQAVIGRADRRSTLAGITCPTAIIHGAGDRLIPLTLQKNPQRYFPPQYSPPSKAPATCCTSNRPTKRAPPSTLGSTAPRDYPHSRPTVRVQAANHRA